MTIQSLTYKDVPAAKRRSSAARAIQQLREKINNPGLSEDQIAKLKAELANLEKWSAGTL